MNYIDLLVFGAYFVVVIGVAMWASWKPKGQERTSEDFFLASRILPWWVVGTTLIGSNISAEQMVGMTGSAFAGGLAVVSYEWMAAVTLLIVAKWMLPVFLKMQIYSMPQYLEERFDKRVSMGLAVFWLLLYVFVNLTSVSYLGALTLQNLIGQDFLTATGFEFKLIYGIIGLFLISCIYTLTGGLAAVAWTDVIQVSVLFIGGLSLTYFGLEKAGVDASGTGHGIVAGFQNLWTQAPDHFHTVMKWDHKEYPWIGIFIGGMWAANLSYWGCSQYITQRALAGKNLKEAQRGLVFAAFLKVLVPAVVLLPGIVCFVLFKDQVPISPVDGHVMNDKAYSVLIKNLVPIGFKGLIVAAMVAAIVGALNSMVNSIATIFTMDLYRKINTNAKESQLVFMGRAASLVAVVIAILVAPSLSNLGQAFQYIQEYTGMVSPGITAIFFLGLFWKRTTSAAALWMVILTIPVSAFFKFLPGIIRKGPDLFSGVQFGGIVAAFMDPFLNRMGVAMVIIFAVGIIVSLYTPQARHKHYDEMEESLSFKTDAVFNTCAVSILVVLTILYLRFF